MLIKVVPFVYFSDQSSRVSRVSKSVLYQNFKQTCAKIGRQDLLQAGGTYYEAKQNAVDFQQAKKLMLRKFKATGFGKWVEKPAEEEMFS